MLLRPQKDGKMRKYRTSLHNMQSSAKPITGIPVTKCKAPSIIFSEDIHAIPNVRRVFHQPLTEIDLIYMNVSSAKSAYPSSRLIISYSQIPADATPGAPMGTFDDLGISLSGQGRYISGGFET